MAASESRSLRNGIYKALARDPKITGLLGGAKIFEQVPQNAFFPYLTLGQTSLQDWRTGADDSSEHTVTLHVWSRGDSKKQTDAIIDTVRAALNSAPLEIDNGHFVELRHEYSEARHDEDQETYHGIVRYRAVTLPVN